MKYSLMDPSKKSQHAIRRSTRLALEVPVQLVSLDAAFYFSDMCNTTLERVSKTSPERNPEAGDIEEGAIGAE